MNGGRRNNEFRAKYKDNCPPILLVHEYLQAGVQNSRVPGRPGDEILCGDAQYFCDLV